MVQIVRGAWAAALSVMISVLIASVPLGGAAALDLPFAATGGSDLARELATTARQQSRANLPSVDALRTQALDAAAVQNWEGAVAAFELLVGQEPVDPAAWLGYAEALTQYDPWSYRTLNAAYRAYTLASADKAKAQALYLVAQALDRQSYGAEAIAAMRESVGLVPTDTGRGYLADLEQRFGFKIEQTEVQADQDIPGVCLIFNRDLATDRRIAWRDYIRLSPETPFEVRALGSRLCVEGLAFGQSYDVTVLPGIRAGDGDVIAAEDVFSVTVGDRTPIVAFRGNAYILPRAGEGTVPLTTVNVPAVQLRLLRINDRNLVQQFTQSRIGESVYLWDLDQIAASDGEEVWTGHLDVDDRRNASVTTAIPLSEMLPAPEPGIYVLAARDAAKAEDPYAYDDPGIQWVVVTDLGLATFTGLDGMHVAVRSLDRATPLAGARLLLLARNNKILGEATSDAEGLVQFDHGLVTGEGGNRPAAVMAYTDSDFAVLDLTQGGFDFSDRGVSGRAEPGPQDAFLYTDRGVYRPGETVELTALLRNDRARALDGLPLTIRLVRPDGVEAVTEQVADQGEGGRSLAIPLPDSAYTGTWTASAYVDPDGAAIGQVYFQVEDFVPARIRVTLTPQAPQLTVGQRQSVTLAAAFLYGAPAADLATEAQLTLATASDPWPDHPGYSFGLVQDDVVNRSQTLSPPATDAAGASIIEIALDQLPDTTRPLEATLRGTVFDSGGRPANASVTLPVREGHPWIGIKRLFDGAIEEGGTAGFEVIALDGDGNRVALGDLTYTLVAEEYDYQWYSYGSSWNYNLVIRDRPLKEGTIAVAAGAPARIEEKLDWGRYRIDITDARSGAASSIRFDAGWWTSGVQDPTPDKLDVALDRTSYAAGDSMTVRIDPPFESEVLVLIANDRLLAARNVAVPKDGATVEIPVGEDWGAGAYVLATAFRPDGAGGERVRGPGRAVGVAWFGIDVASRTLTVDIGTPAEIRPDRTLDVPIRVTGGPADLPGYVTLAAVDEGILLLTDFKSPDPVQHYYGRRALGIDMIDAYGRLIVSAGDRGRLRTGGDGGADQRQGLPERSTRTIALFSGVVALDAEGRATIPLAIPDFDGELRLMAVAWNGDAVGRAAKPLLVRNPVIAEMVTPRFLAPGDTAEISFVLRNLAGAAGDYGVRFAADPPLAVDGAAKSAAALAMGEEFRTRVAVRAGAIGVGRLHYSVIGPDGFAVARDVPISIRPAQPYETQRIATILQPGESSTISAGLVDRFVPGSAVLSASFTTRPNFDVPGLLQALNGYPYGCAEQTISTAMPLLYLTEVAAGIGSDFKPTDMRRRVQSGIDRLMTMQGPDGGFGWWSVYGNRNPWLAAYAMDFLTRARDMGYRVSERAYQRGIRYLADYLDSDEVRSSCATSGAYALHVVTRAGAGSIADMRYLADTCLSQYGTAMAAAQIGAAAAEFGDTMRADAAFAQARTPYPEQPGPVTLVDYGTPLRDYAAATVLMGESGQPLADILDEADRAGQIFNRSRWHSTQEMAWLLLAAKTMLTDPAPMSLTIDGAAPTVVDGAVDLSGEDLAGADTAVVNTGDGRIRQIVSVRGVPADPQPAGGDGFEIERVFLDADGRVFDPQARPLVQGELFTVLIRGRATDGADHQALIVDLVPAGVEIENPAIGDGAVIGEMGDVLSAAAHIERRDDRFIAAVDLDGSQQQFTVAYLARAVTPGSYVLPGSYVEDMYLPQYSARTGTGSVRIEPAR
jgi:uncharacterized protein YfaS (alpha-2-macroglobulin family)